MITVAPHTLRRYVIDRSAGRSPRQEWAFYEPGLGVWIRANEATAQRHEHHRCIRIEGLKWCDVLGHRTDVVDDCALQAYFLTVTPDDWQALAIAVTQHPNRCLRDWRAAGKRIIASVSGWRSLFGGPLSDWPGARGSGPRSMLPR